MATRSSILAWEIPRTEEPGVQGVARVRHDLATKQQQQQTHRHRKQTYGYQRGKLRGRIN